MKRQSDEVLVGEIKEKGWSGLLRENEEKRLLRVCIYIKR